MSDFSGLCQEGHLAMQKFCTSHQPGLSIQLTNPSLPETVHLCGNWVVITQCLNHLLLYISTRHLE